MARRRAPAPIPVPLLQEAFRARGAGCRVISRADGNEATAAAWDELVLVLRQYPRAAAAMAAAGGRIRGRPPKWSQLLRLAHHMRSTRLPLSASSSSRAVREARRYLAAVGVNLSEDAVAERLGTLIAVRAMFRLGAKRRAFELVKAPQVRQVRLDEWRVVEEGVWRRVP